MFQEIIISFKQIEEEDQIKSHGFYDGLKIRRLYSFDTFYVKKEKILALKKKCKRLWEREILKKRAACELYNNFVHELRIEDREFYFK